jgi:TetR/AcrR family transcriptional regulator
MAVINTRMSATDRRAQLIDVAIDLFAKKGFGGTTTREIAAAAGVTEAIIFRHFATKQDLYKAILDTRCGTMMEHAPWFSELRQLMDRNDDEGVFRALLTAIIKFKREDPRFERLMLHAVLEGNELAMMHHKQFAVPIGAQLIEYVELRQKAGAIRRVDPKAVIFAVAGIAQFYANQKYLHQSGEIPLSDEAVIETFLSILMKGLR